MDRWRPRSSAFGVGIPAVAHQREHAAVQLVVMLEFDGEATDLKPHLSRRSRR